MLLKIGATGIRLEPSLLHTEELTAGAATSQGRKHIPQISARPMDVIGRGPLSKHVFDHFAEDVSEAEVTTLVAVGEAFVVDAELMEDGSL